MPTPGSSDSCKLRNGIKIVTVFEAIPDIVSHSWSALPFSNFLVKLLDRFFVEDYFDLAKIFLFPTPTTLSVISNSSPSFGFPDDVAVNPQPQ